MRDIAGDFFSRSPAMAGPIIALVLFFIVFVSITVRVMRRRAASFASDAALPLSEEGEHRGAVSAPSEIRATVRTEEPTT